MGAWIETIACVNRPPLNNVAPRVGAWIETILSTDVLTFLSSHPVWVRGLKHAVPLFRPNGLVAPRVGAWIETRRAAV